MAKFQQPTAEQVINWVKSNFPECKQRKGGSELTINNPFDDDTGRNFNINARNEPFFCHDWRSDDWAGPPNPKTGKRLCTFLNFVRRYLKCTYRQALAAVAGGDVLPALRCDDKPEQADGVRPLALPTGTKQVTASNCPKAAQIVLKWLASRGIDRELADLHSIHHCGTDAVFPYLEYGSIVYWQMRSAVDKSFKFPDKVVYGVGKDQFLYNFDGIEPASYLIVTEAIIGSITLAEQATATGGADMTLMQARKIKMLGPRDGVVLAPDNDLAGVKSVVHNGGLLGSLGLPVYYSLPPRLPFKNDDGEDMMTKDWNELEVEIHMSKRDVRKVLESSIKPYDVMARVRLCNEIARLEAARKH